MKRLRMLVSFLMVMTLIVSCQEEVGTGTLKVLLHCDITKTITAASSSLDVVKYTVSGSGPGGKNFCVDSTSSSVTLDGIVMGQWEISAIAYNVDSKAIAQGTCNVDFAQASQSVSLNLEEMTGNGSLLVKFTWDEEVSNPIIDIWIYSVDSKELFNKTVTVGAGKTYYNFSISQIPCGTYCLKAILKNNELKTGGMYEAIRITSGEKTSATLSFCNTFDYPESFEELYVPNGNSPLKGHLEGLSETVSSGESHDVTLVLDSNYSGKENCFIQWFLDGEQVSDSEKLAGDYSQAIRVSNGMHILNAVVINRDDKAVGSAGFKFSAKPIAKKGVPVFNAQVAGSNSIKLAEDTVVGALPNNRFLVFTPSECSLQLCSVYNNQLVVIRNYTSAYEGFAWVSNGTSLYSDSKMNILAAVDGENNVDFLLYDKTEDTLKNATYEGEIQRFEGKDPTTEVPIGHISFIKCMSFQNGGAFFICDSTGRTIVYPSSTDNETITNKGVGMKPGEFKLLKDLTAKSSYLVCVVPDSSEVFYTTFENKSVSSQWKSFISRINSPENVLLLNSENLLISGDSLLCKYVRYSMSGWVWHQTVEIDAKLMISSYDGNFVYVSDKEGNLMSFATGSGRLVKISSTYIEENIKQLVLNGNDLIAVCDSGKLILFTIAQEDNL